MRFRKSRGKEPVRVVRIAQQEWTQDDMAFARSFFSGGTFKRVKAFCDEQLVKLMLDGRASEEYRNGWIDCQRQYEAFANVEDEGRDSPETTSMQMIADE